MSVQIIADSACDLPNDLVEALNIHIVPLMVLIGEKEYEDCIDISENMYDQMKNGVSVSTSQVPYEKYHAVFSKYAEAGVTCIHIGFSSGLSGSFQTSNIVANEFRALYPNFDITCIDSLSASIGYGLIVHKAAQMAKAGASKESIIEAVHYYIDHVEHIFTVDTLEYLHRGGRVSKASKIVGDLLNIKPILDVQDGKLIPIEKIRGRKKSIRRMIDIVEERGDQLDKQVVGINHAVDLETALSARDMLQERFGIKSFIIREVGAVIGSHSGPGTFSIFFLNKYDPSID